jgi:CheY-like chemotaxis protein
MDSLQNLIEGLAQFGRTSETFYRQVAEVFRHDHATVAFAGEQECDESWFLKVAARAAGEIAGGPPIAFPLTVDPARFDFDGPPQAPPPLELREGAGPADLAGLLLETELTEWNMVYTALFAVLRERQGPYHQAVVRLQQHLRRAELFLDTLPLSPEQRRRMTELPTIWRERILVVDDDPTVRVLLETILQEEGTVDAAPDGWSGLEKVRENYYALIVSDIQMPRMDGIAFYREAARQFEGIGNRFLFFSSAVEGETAAFIKSQELAYLDKPTRLAAIRRQAQQILRRQAAPC